MNLPRRSCGARWTGGSTVDCGGIRLSLHKSAITMVEMLIVVFVLGLLVVLLVAMLRTRHVKQDWGSCINHLKFTGLAFQQWADDNNSRYPMQVPVTNGGTRDFLTNGEAAVHFRILSNYLNTPTVLWCPRDAGRTRGRDFSGEFNNSNVSYFLGVDVNFNFPAMLLAGDRLMTISGKQAASGALDLHTNSPVGWTKSIHNGKGNLLFVDGHTEQSDTQLLQASLRRTAATNRVLIP